MIVSEFSHAELFSENYNVEAIRWWKKIGR